MRRRLAWCLLPLLALQLAACGSRSGDAEVARSPDDLLGVWVPDAAPRELTANGAPPPLTEEAAGIHAEHKQRYAAGDAGYDPTTWCAGPGLPRILTMPYAFEIRRTGNHLAFIHDWYRWFRAVDLDGPEVTDYPAPMTLGYSVGRFEGDTLVIRTVGISDSTVLDASGLPHSDELVITERLRVLPDGRLENRMTFEDPQTFTAPWETVLTFHRDPSAKVGDDVCPDRLANGEPAERLPTATTGAPPAPAAAPAPAVQTAAAGDFTPRLTGMYEPKFFGMLIPEAKFNARGQEIVDRNAKEMASGRIVHTAWTSCRPGAVSTMTMPRERILVLESPEEVTILYEMPRMVRRIRMNAEHPRDLQPSYVGHSVGRWEGETLVVDSIGFNGYAELGAHGQPTSPQLHTVERFTRAADGSIDIEVTVDDPEYYSEPVRFTRGWKPSESRHLQEYDCMENPREEDFENAYYVRDRYKPVCARVAGKGMELSRMVCGM
jgi:hypothetical protein